MGVCSSENEDSGSYGGLTRGQAVSPLFPTLTHKKDQNKHSQLCSIEEEAEEQPHPAQWSCDARLQGPRPPGSPGVRMRLSRRWGVFRGKGRHEQRP